MAADPSVKPPEPPPPADQERRLDPHDPLWADPDPTVDAALAAALPTAKPTERTGLIQVILNRGQLHALTAAVEWADLKDPLEKAMLTKAAEADLDGPIRALITRGRGQGCRHALALIRDARLTRLAYLLTELIRHGREGMPDEAAAVLVGLAEQPDVDAAERFALCRAIDEAVAAYDRHRHPGVLDAFLRLQPSPMPRALSAMTRPDHAAVQALAPRLAAAEQRWERKALLPLAPAAALTSALQRGIAKAAKHGGLGDVLTAGHLISEPATRSLLASTKDCKPLQLSPEATAALAPEQRRWLPALWSVLPLQPGRRLQLLETLKTASDRGSRLSSLRMTAHAITTDETLDTQHARRRLFVGLAHDADEPVARLAARALDRDLAAQHQVGDLAGLAGSPHSSVRAAAGLRLGPALFEKLWKTEPKARPAEQGAALRALRKLDPDFDRKLTARLTATHTGPHPPANHNPGRALRWVEQLGHPDAFAPHALARAHPGGTDHRVVATAAAVLAGYPGSEATALLTQLTEHDDARVRANAIESLTRHRTGESPDISFTAWADDDHARPRANAIRGLLTDDYRAGLSALSEMLRDGRPDHRRSALWLARIAGLLDAKKQAAPTDPAATGATPPSNLIKAQATADDSELTDEAASVSELLAELYAQADEDQGAAA